MGTIEELIVLGQQLTAFKLYLYASVSILIYDYIITFDDEVKYIWGQRMTFGTYLFLFTRYYAPLAFAVTVHGSWYLTWDTDMCRRVTMIESFNTIILIAAAMLGMLLRTHCLYLDNRLVLFCLIPFLFAFVAAATYIYIRPLSGPLPLPRLHHTDLFKGCILVPDHGLGAWDAAPVIVAWVYDNLIFILTIVRTLHIVKSSPAALVFYTVLKNGALYFLIIGAANLVTILFIFYGPPGLKFINYNPTIVLIIVLVNRSTLDLRRGCRKEQTMLPMTEISIHFNFPTTGSDDDAQSTPHHHHHHHRAERSPRRSIVHDLVRIPARATTGYLTGDLNVVFPDEPPPSTASLSDDGHFRAISGPSMLERRRGAAGGAPSSVEKTEKRTSLSCPIAQI